MRILIVDDESIIRKGIEKVVLETQLFEEVMTAKNGKEAYELCQEYKFDVMLVDIMMPIMGGLEFLRALQQSEMEKHSAESEHAIKIIVSGYDEFEYAKQAIELGVEEFLLKPLSPEDIKGLTSKVYHQAKLNREKSEGILELRRKVEESLPALRDKFFYDLINIDSPSQNLYATADLLGISIHYESFQVALLGFADNSVDHPMDGQLALQRAVTILKEIHYPSDELHIFQHGTSQLALLFCWKEKRTREEVATEEYLAKASEKVKKKTGMPLFCGLGTVVYDLGDICHSNLEARSAMRYTASVKREAVQYILDIRSTGALNVTLESLYELCDMLRYCRRRSAHDWLQVRLDLIKNSPSRVTSEEIEGLVSGIRLSGLDAMRSIGVDREATSFYPYYRMIPSSGAIKIEELSSKLIEYIEKVMSLIESEEQGKNRRFVDQAMAYAEEHYVDNITTQSVAEELGLSRNYFGQLFKKETGTVFSEYLSKLRIQKAKKLLRGSNLKIYQISEQVGIEDSFYFSSLFKKFAGLSPSEYREQG